MDKLDESNVLLYAAKYYDNPNCYDTIEFYEDLNRFKYLKRLFNKYSETGELKERLIINHLVVLYNVFGVEATTRMLFLKLRDNYPQLKPFLVMMGYMPEIVRHIGVENKTIITSDIVSDPTIEKLLQNI